MSFGFDTDYWQNLIPINGLYFYFEHQSAFLEILYSIVCPTYTHIYIHMCLGVILENYFEYACKKLYFNALLGLVVDHLDDKGDDVGPGPCKVV